MTEEDRDAVKAVLSPQMYEKLSPPKIPRSQWIPGYLNVFLGLVFKFRLGQPGKSA